MITGTGFQWFLESAVFIMDAEREVRADLVVEDKGRSTLKAVRINKQNKKQTKERMIFGAWNLHTLLDRDFSSRPETRTTLTTLFRQADEHKTTWMHPTSKQWYLIDYAICRLRDIRQNHQSDAGGRVLDLPPPHQVYLVAAHHSNPSQDCKILQASFLILQN